MKKILKPLAVVIPTSLFMAQAGAANTWAEARSDAMGGTGVASASYGSAPMINPALLAKAKPDDNVTVVLPSAGVQVTDKDNLQDEIDTINDKINYYQDVIDDIASGGPPGYLQALPQFQNAARDLADELEFLDGKTAHASAGAGITVAIPNDVLSVAFVAKGYAHARVSSYIDPNDITYLRGIENNDLTAAIEAAKALIGGSDEITDNLKSTAFGRAAIVSDYGISLARQFQFGDVPVSFGITPKLQKTWLYNYTASIYNYDSSDFRNSRYRNDNTGFNIDAGVAADFGDNVTVGLSGQNLFSRDIDTKEINGYKDTYQIRPLVTAGAAWHNDWLTLSADGDLTETKGFKSEKPSQYAGVGAEVTPLSWLAVRAGFRGDMKGNDVNVFTGGLGFAPFNRVRLDLTGIVGEDEAWGAGAQLSMTF